MMPTGPQLLREMVTEYRARNGDLIARRLRRRGRTPAEVDAVLVREVAFPVLSKYVIRELVHLAIRRALGDELARFDLIECMRQRLAQLEPRA